MTFGLIVIISTGTATEAAAGAAAQQYPLDSV